VGFDLGGMVNIIDRLNAGISFTGISTNISWNSNNHSESLPQVVTTGLSYKYVNMFGAAGLSILPSVDVVYNSFSGTKARAGAELSVNDFFFVRAGYNDSLTVGAGVRLKPSDIFSVKIDYAYSADTVEPGASNHRIGAVIVYVFPETGVQHRSVSETRAPQSTGEKQDKPAEQPKKNEHLEDYEW
jgi:opacity protein-like surface antigen